jgi:Sgf11 (transcriptional regulation protein)
MKSAAIAAQLAAEENEASQAATTPTTSTATLASPTEVTSKITAEGLTVNTQAAVWINGQVFLKGNPMTTVTENLCPKCRLPRYHEGLGSKTAIPGKKWCSLLPYIDRAGVDIWGNQFPSESGKPPSKRDKEAAAKLLAEHDAMTPNSAESPGGTPPGSAVKTNELRGFPTVQCTANCKRYFSITKFAKHLESCMGRGRRSARNGTSVLPNGGTAMSTPLGSRSGTPVSSTKPPTLNGKAVGDPSSTTSSPTKRSRDDNSDDDDEEESTPKKKVKTKAEKETEKDYRPLKPSKLNKPKPLKKDGKPKIFKDPTKEKVNGITENGKADGLSSLLKSPSSDPKKLKRKADGPAGDRDSMGSPLKKQKNGIPTAIDRDENENSITLSKSVSQHSPVKPSPLKKSTAVPKKKPPKTGDDSSK